MHIKILDCLYINKSIKGITKVEFHSCLKCTYLCTSVEEEGPSAPVLPLPFAHASTLPLLL